MLYDDFGLAAVLAVALLGLFVASAVWIVARNQALRRPLFAAPVCAGDLGLSLSPRPTDAVPPEEPATDDPDGVAPAEQRCGTRLPFRAWLPLRGFGRAAGCSVCGAVPPTARLVFEGLVACYFALAAFRPDGWLELAAVLVFAVPLLIILLVDAWTRLIYLNVIGAGIALGLLFAVAADGPRSLLTAALAMAAAVAVFLGFFFLAIVLYRNVRVVPFGKGDIYLAAMIASMVLFDDLVPALFYGVVLAGLGGVLLIATKRVGRRQAMPYGPFLCLGALIALVT
jgi:leader peptidase (prepilin peptidase)/N-methyltransferase